MLTEPRVESGRESLDIEAAEPELLGRLFEPGDPSIGRDVAPGNGVHDPETIPFSSPTLFLPIGYTLIEHHGAAYNGLMELEPQSPGRRRSMLAIGQSERPNSVNFDDQMDALVQGTLKGAPCAPLAGGATQTIMLTY